jgi:hypothetical protein
MCENHWRENMNSEETSFAIWDWVRNALHVVKKTITAVVTVVKEVLGIVAEQVKTVDESPVRQTVSVLLTAVRFATLVVKNSAWLSAVLVDLMTTSGAVLCLCAVIVLALIASLAYLFFVVRAVEMWEDISDLIREGIEFFRNAMRYPICNWA